MIERLRIRNFRRYQDATVVFQEGLNTLEGPNNAGKTTLFFAIEYAFFGRVEGFKTIRALMQPGKKSIGVEIVFHGRAGDRFLLQRVHRSGAKSKKTLDGQFTLKQLVDDGETYLLASDFGDTEDKLALKLQELTGLTRRFFCIALHMRQGEIPAILDGSKQLDIVLGVTAAAMAEDELRQMALELEKESAGFAVYQERLRAIGAELAGVRIEVEQLATERSATEAKLAALGDASDPRKELEIQLAPLQKSLGGYEPLQRRAELASRRLTDEHEHTEDFRRSGPTGEVDRELVALEAGRAKSAKQIADKKTEVEAFAVEERILRERRGDVCGRLDRRKALPKGKGAKCEVCGAPVDAAQTKKEVGQWTGEIETLDAQLAELAAKQKESQTAFDAAETTERQTGDRIGSIQKFRVQLSTLEKKLAERAAEAEAATHAEKKAFATIESEAKGLAKLGLSWTLDGEPTEVVTSIHAGIQKIQHALAEKVGRQVAERQALAELLIRLESQAQSQAKRHADLEREETSARASAAALEVKAARATRFRRIATAFKEYQVRVRAEASVQLAADAIALHRRLSATDEFTSLVIDPAQYSVQIVPNGFDEEVPASLYEGGGHRLLLGLAYRLAVARLRERCSMLLLDEPTDGLDTAHRQSLLERIGDSEIARQVIVITHHAGDNPTGHRVQLERRDRETIIVKG